LDTVDHPFQTVSKGYLENFWYVGRRAGLFLCFLAAIVWFWAELFAIDDNGLLIALWNTLVRLGIFLIITFLLTSLKAAYDREYRLARVDGLTGVINWRSFQETLQAELSRRERYQYPHYSGLY
jgi:predicted signal transduction protein with EAL and GGDEF domain